MQLISWTIARLGSRFGLHFDPYHQRVMHSALGRFLDGPLDLMVGLVEPDGTERALPFSTRGTPFHTVEQFERLNSVTFRAFSPDYRLRFELNVHSVFYPQDEELCILPAIYLEMRVHPVERFRWLKPKGRAPEKVRLFLRLRRPQTRITASARGMASIDLAYENRLVPQLDDPHMGEGPLPDDGRRVRVQERIVCLNDGAAVDDEGQGLTLELPVTEVGSGTKWRLVWGAFCDEPVLRDLREDPKTPIPGYFRYTRHWKSLDAVMEQAISRRDEYLGRSRLFEKIVEQAPLGPAKVHLINQSFQSFLSNTFWCELDHPTGRRPWFSVWEGSSFFHATLDVEYNNSLFYLTLWPDLLAMLFDQWARHEVPHAASGGSCLEHDMGLGCDIRRQAFDHPMPVEENCDYLLMLQAYAHWTGDLTLARRHADLLKRLADYLLWTDRDGSGFPSEGTANTLDDASPAVQYARKQTYLAIKRLAALSAADDLLTHVGRPEDSQAIDRYARSAAHDMPKVDHAAWLGDHYAVCVDRSAAGVHDAWTGETLPYVEIPGWDAYSIYTANGLLLPIMAGQPVLFDHHRLVTDIYNAFRETLGPYGCAHTSTEPDNVWISQNLWRDHLWRYLGEAGSDKTHRYWDLQVMSNTGPQCHGFIDTYIGNYLCFYPRGITSLGFFLAYPRLVIDRLAPGGARISVDPDRGSPQRWPLLPLVDWRAGKVPVCVIHPDGRVQIENDLDPVIVRGEMPTGVDTDMIG